MADVRITGTGNHNVVVVELQALLSENLISTDHSAVFLVATKLTMEGFGIPLSGLFPSDAARRPLACDLLDHPGFVTEPWGVTRWYAFLLAMAVFVEALTWDCFRKFDLICGVLKD
ncbi:uncharacterized protein FFB20_05667 [Fusarium fujikuroi]|uniref:Uncharacterized protein n=1 Tax=Gibberella fujikuroi (strain CBS 195.34 / IMI 58289 / NRRL A-6831) TaxID=1279085 RepID=S0EB13_GIBF5|nr:uncharacterized protein FFUJ_13943 [Fusarium fujikuroi IMI 58289]SCN78146.1 uncharacterized protein FFB20_05667 [Fusarium fujikuroi]CCT72059.1 uncharacterized protein FFUJ_13943 [Fusarium fujikuroi IMI 58289]SCO10994.1 uncharacterized protein FFC1_11318 [Fusarium fujikuroi]SCO13454.1 uncharacterized protein FFE2_12826 [Fusarium fujikuroi]SCO18119.1 uncharacterized protein FFM5_11750 [Fusarium fujikuroi]